jgi:hypothetical protein
MTTKQNDPKVSNYIDQYQTNFVSYVDEVNAHRALNHLRTFEADLDLCKDLTFDTNWYLFLQFGDL